MRFILVNAMMYLDYTNRKPKPEFKLPSAVNRDFIEWLMMIMCSAVAFGGLNKGIYIRRTRISFQ